MTSARKAEATGSGHPRTACVTWTPQSPQHITHSGRHSTCTVPGGPLQAEECLVTTALNKATVTFHWAEDAYTPVSGRSYAWSIVAKRPCNRNERSERRKEDCVQCGGCQLRARNITNARSPRQVRSVRWACSALAAAKPMATLQCYM